MLPLIHGYNPNEVDIMILIFLMRKLRWGGQRGEGTSQGHTTNEQKSWDLNFRLQSLGCFPVNYIVLSDLGKAYLSKMGKAHRQEHIWVCFDTEVCKVCLSCLGLLICEMEEVGEIWPFKSSDSKSSPASLMPASVQLLLQNMSPCLPQSLLCTLTIRHYPLQWGFLILYAPFFKYADIVHL